MLLTTRGDHHTCPPTGDPQDRRAAPGGGQVQAARDLNRDTLARRRQTLGPDHPDTLASASHLAHDLRELGEIQAARDLDHDTLARRRQILGPDHPHTLASAASLATDPPTLGQAENDPSSHHGART